MKKYLAFVLFILMGSANLNAGIILVSNINDTGDVPYDSTLAPNLVPFFNLDLDGLQNQYFLQLTGAGNTTATSTFNAINALTLQNVQVDSGATILGALDFHLDPVNNGAVASNNVKFDLDLSAFGTPVQLLLIRDTGNLALTDSFLDTSLGRWSNAARGLENDDTISVSDAGGGIFNFDVTTATAIHSQDSFRVVAITAVPEPSSLAFLGVGSVVAFLNRKRLNSRRKK